MPASLHLLDPYPPSNHFHLSYGAPPCLSFPLPSIHSPTKVFLSKHKSDHISPAPDLPMLPIIHRIKFKLLNVTLRGGAPPTSPAASCLPPSTSRHPGTLAFSLTLKQEALVQHELLSLLEESSLPSFPAGFFSSFRSQHGCQFLQETFSDTPLRASSAGTLPPRYSPIL